MACRYTYKGKTYQAWEFDDVLKAMPPIEAAKYMKGVKPIKEPVSLSGKQVAWLRMNERTDAEGNKGTFLEEIQSQRGAEGKTKGFATAVTDAQRARHTQLDGIPAWKITEKEFDELQELNRVLNSTATPAAPFITTAKNRASDAYILLLLKKALSSAIDNGHKFVSWTTGEQQADRYNLSKSISEVSLTKEGVFRAYDKDKAVVLTKYTTDENEIATYIGAELAHNLVTQRFQKRGIVEAKRLEGLELSTEPSWTKTMYGDSQGLDGSGKPSLILQAASELARKFGGKTGTVKLSTGEQPALIVTPEMKAKVLSSGMPMFMFQEENKDDISARQNKTDSAAANQQAGQQLPSADELSADREKDDELLRTSLLRVNGFTPDGKVKEVKVGDSKIVFQVRWNIPTDVHISSIRTAIAKRGAGAARKALSAFLRQTDSQNLSTSLEASPLDNKTNAKRLEGFYESLGFKSTGKTINPMGDKEMVREPRFMFQEDIFDKKPQREAPEVEQVSEVAPEAKSIDLTDTFKKLDSRTRKSTREKAIAELAEHKDRILYINDNFIDILSELEKLPGFEIKC